MLSSLCIVAALATLAMGLRLESRAGQTAAVCSSSFSWMDNMKQASPCLAAATVDVLCAPGGEWTILALNATVTYTNPNGTTANLCTCSWTNYNLLSACTACQNFPEQIPAWSDFKLGCTAGELSDTFFPESLTLPSTVAIPLWAQQNPTQWTDQKFSVSQAQTIANKNLPDFVGGESTAVKKKKNIGAIVGGVIGGVVVIVGGVLVALWMIRRQRKSKVPSGTYDNRPSGHMRSMSDLSTASNLKSVHGPYASLSANAMLTNPPTSPTVMTHTSSIRSVPYLSSVANSTAPYGTSSPPPIPVHRQGTPIQDVIEPFVLPPTVDNPDRKQANGSYPIQVYDHPFAPPNIMRMDSVAQTQTPSSARGRFNPPAYTESSPGGSSSGRQPHRAKQPSTDTQTSLTSSRNGGNNAHSPDHSGPGMVDIVEHMGPPPPHESYESEYGRQVSTSRDEKRRPPQNSLNGNDLA